MDIIGLTALAAALVGLGVAVYGILDVRKQVRYLVALQRNLAWSEVLHKMVLQFVELTAETREFRAPPELHEFTMLVRAVEPKKTLDETQAYAINEIISLARDMVAHGLATWKPDMDENVIEEIVTKWQKEKRDELMKSMFPKPKPWWRFGFGE